MFNFDSWSEDWRSSEGRLINDGAIGGGLPPRELTTMLPDEALEIYVDGPVADRMMAFYSEAMRLSGALRVESSIDSQDN